MGFIRFLRDLPHLRYHFGKLGTEGWAKLARDEDGPGDPNHDAAWAVFTRAYALPEFGQALHSMAAQDLAGALARGPLPDWAATLLTRQEFKQLKGVKKQ